MIVRTCKCHWNLNWNDMKCLGRLYNRLSPRVPIFSKIIFEMLCNQLGLSTTKSNRDYRKRVLPRLVPVAYLQSEVWFAHCIIAFVMLCQLLSIRFNHQNTILPLKSWHKQRTQWYLWNNVLRMPYRRAHCSEVFLPSLMISIISSGWKLSSSTSVAS